MDKKISRTLRISESINRKLKYYVIDKDTNATEVINKLLKEHLEKEGY